MGSEMSYQTEQEDFWAGSFGDEYIDRNKSDQLHASNLNFFVRALHQAGKIESCIEFGANIGMNLRALKSLFPGIKAYGVEINQEAASQLSELIGKESTFAGSIYDYKPDQKYQLSFVKGVLIHINPEMLDKTYEIIYNSSSRDILIAEYYNPAPVTIPYRGHQDRLFKRDFAGDMLEKFSDLDLIDYGFAYKRDPAFPQDDITWFLLRKRG